MFQDHYLVVLMTLVGEADQQHTVLQFQSISNIFKQKEDPLKNITPYFFITQIL